MDHPELNDREVYELQVRSENLRGGVVWFDFTIVYRPVDLRQLKFSSELNCWLSPSGLWFRIKDPLIHAIVAARQSPAMIDIPPLVVSSPENIGQAVGRPRSSRKRARPCGSRRKAAPSKPSSP